MLSRAPPRSCSGGAGNVRCRHDAPSRRPWVPAGGLARGGQRAGVKLVAARPATRTVVVAAAAGERRPVGPERVAAVADGTMLANGSAVAGISKLVTSTIGKSTNILWHDCPIGQNERQKLLNQKGCVVWITGLSGSGKSTLACALSRELHSRGHLTYVLDGDNLRHGLNRDLSFKAEDRVENIRRVGEVAKLFADAGLICIASLISPYRSDRSACRNLLPNSSFIEVFLNAPLEICEARDPKGLYKLARAGKIKGKNEKPTDCRCLLFTRKAYQGKSPVGFTGIDDPYEPPSDCEIVIQCNIGHCPSPKSMADQVVSYLEANGFLQD
ncbi:Adenylyl-sulfate kinase 3 [Dichanthelium oligosanthes]|uniref:Adenylyl-sulfate kinase n=1 Tax=Dichanthelium oligosanthes TaxID=888268 RepID=A0A1E5V554_9POAL|nr:Adenylyl-sulfate kinase 3 [Dichanthelium oligosanthes]